MNTFAANILNASSNKTCLFSVGQAGFIIKSASGQMLGIDLYLSDCVERLEGHKGFKRLLPKILFPNDIQLDCIIATHHHWDHFDVDSMGGLMSDPKTKLFAPDDCNTYVDFMRIADDRVVYVKPLETYTCGDFILHFVNCDHGQGAPSAVGVIVEVDGKRILEVGDTCLRLDRVEEYLSFGKLNVLVAPINGAYGNMNEKECAELAEALKPIVTVPCHYGMFASHGGRIEVFYRMMTEEYPDNAFLIMAQGEKYEII